MDAIVARHTTPEQAAGIFSKVSPRLAVFSTVLEQQQSSSRHDDPMQDGSRWGGSDGHRHRSRGACETS